MNFIHALILAVVEGITEFLPISSTGHMIITSSLMGIEESSFTKAFEVIIQFGAILSVLVLYWRRFLADWSFYQKISLAFLPTAFLGFLFKDIVDQMLESVQLVAWSLIVGGVILILSDKWFAKSQDQGLTSEELPALKAVKIGFFQSIAMIPGVSRSGATILGGLVLGMRKKDAAEFSFFLAVPTMGAACAYKLLKIYKTIQPQEWSLLLIGSAVAFLVAIVAIRFFIGIVSRYGFKYFGYYRIALGLTILVLLYSGTTMTLH